MWWILFVFKSVRPVLDNVKDQLKRVIWVPFSTFVYQDETNFPKQNWFINPEERRLRAIVNIKKWMIQVSFYFQRRNEYNLDLFTGKTFKNKNIQIKFHTPWEWGELG